MDACDLAVLIPVWKTEAAEILRQNIQVFKNLDYPPKTKVYWLLHDSDDQTPHKICHLPFGLLVDNTYPPLKAHALNNAIEKIEAKVFAVFDVDAIPEKDFLVKGFHRLLEENRKDENVVGVQGASYCYVRKNNWLARHWRREYPKKRLLANRCHGNGFLIFRGALQGLGGFPATVTEDKHLRRKIMVEGLKIYQFEGKIREEAPTEIRGWFGQNVRWKVGDGVSQCLIWGFERLGKKLFPFLILYLILISPPSLVNTITFLLLLVYYSSLFHAFSRKRGNVRWYLEIYVLQWIYIIALFKAALDAVLRPLHWFHTPKTGMNPERAKRWEAEHI